MLAKRKLCACVDVFSSGALFVFRTAIGRCEMNIAYKREIERERKTLKKGSTYTDREGDQLTDCEGLLCHELSTKWKSVVRRFCGSVSDTRVTLSSSRVAHILNKFIGFLCFCMPKTVLWLHA